MSFLRLLRYTNFLELVAYVVVNYGLDELILLLINLGGFRCCSWIEKVLSNAYMWKPQKMYSSSIMACHGLNSKAFRCQMLLTNVGHKILLGSIKNFQQLYNNALMFNNILYHAINTSKCVKRFHLHNTQNYMVYY